jgi:hypothetical protein
MDKPKKVDRFRKLKWLGYKKSNLLDKSTLADMVEYAKFQLAFKTNRLLKDPIWDEYTTEELLIEFYAHQFELNREFRMKFEAEINKMAADSDDFATWADKKIEEDAKIRAKTLGELEDKVRFDPDDVLGGD